MKMVTEKLDEIKSALKDLDSKQTRMLTEIDIRQRKNTKVLAAGGGGLAAIITALTMIMKVYL
jgi:hypothetical protein